MIPMDGVIGLAPDDPANGPSFIATLKNQGKVDDKMFGFMFGDSSIESVITIGGYDKALFKDPKD
jgi:hypothetical protein